MTWIEAWLRWYGVLMAVTWIWAPLVKLLCPTLASRGALMARPLVLLGIVYPSWLLASLDLVPYSTAGTWATAIGGGVVAWALLLRRQRVDRDWLRALLLAEVVSLGAFAAYVWLRGYTPEILNTEKPMDIAFLASSARTDEMPPPDPWLAGEPINYYYLGYLLHGALTRLSGVAPTIGFNLALATTFSMTVAAMAGLGFDAVRPWYSRRRALFAGALAATLLAIAGNSYAALQLLRTPTATWNAGWWDKLHGVGWRASRIVCDGERVLNDCPSATAVETINEFPFFSFLLGDLHPHLTALPFTVVALGLALSLALTRRSPNREHLAGGDWLRCATIGAVTGSLYVLNSWDFPTFLVIALAGMAVGYVSIAPRARPRLAAAMVAAAVAAWLPFFVTFAPLTRGDVEALPSPIRDLPVIPRLLTAVAMYTGERTSIGEFVTLFGVPLIAVIWLLVTDRRRPGADAHHRIPSWLAIVAIAAVGLGIFAQVPLILFCGSPIAIGLWRLRQCTDLTPRTIATALAIAAFTLVLLTEFFYIQDIFSNRMNTLFKVYYQVWTLLALATALTVVIVWREAWPRRVARPAIALFVMVILASGGLYPVLASLRWTEFWGPRDWVGLDGIAYAEQTHPDEFAAINWLQANGRRDDVLLEAAGCSYQPNSQLPFDRASAYTGIPTILGWQGHERQWRSGQPDLLDELGGNDTTQGRPADVAAAFADPNGAVARDYGVTLIYVGQYERDGLGCPIAGPYPGIDSPSFPGPGWEPVFERGSVTIYRRTNDAGG